ncbi:MAG: hypothetical protein A2V93_09505 [Ignavibacteria bacterium RBG_16_34_14]|nr:MAG: hypothetical protein A2V93_09505 [Ignavibacteria bacterium RBG_16_34_14]
MVLFNQNQKYYEYLYLKEEDIESDVIKNAQLFFGTQSIFVESKKKIDSKFIGATVPDGFLFDFSEPDNPEFYIVEVELSSHDFYKHIFPQVTKFFAFIKNQQSQSELIEKLFSLVSSDNSLKKEFKKYLGEKEIYKSIKDIIESSQNILLVIDEEKDELPEIIDTYTDTWGKMVKLIILKKFYSNKDYLYSLNPDFRDIQFADADSIKRVEKEEVTSNYTEEYHLDGVSDKTNKIYSNLKSKILKFDSNLLFNPQRYYVSIRSDRNIAFIKVRKKKIRIIIMLPEEKVKEIIENYPVVSLSAPVQKFYNGPSCAIDIEEEKYLDEIITVLKEKLNKERVVT